MRQKILVVDDDGDVLNLLRMHLGAKGYEVAIAQDGISCMKKVRSERPDLVILDLGLPAGDGFVSLERLKSRIETSHIPVIVLTGQDGRDARDRAFASGASAFFEKGCSNDVLFSAIWRHLGAPIGPIPV